MDKHNKQRQSVNSPEKTLGWVQSAVTLAVGALESVGKESFRFRTVLNTPVKLWELHF